MNYEVISIKVDPATKKRAQNAAEELGLSLSSVIKGFLKQFVRTKTITFSATSEEPSEYLISAIKEARENRKRGKGSPIFTDIESDLKWLGKQGT